MPDTNNPSPLLNRLASSADYTVGVEDFYCNGVLLSTTGETTFTFTDRKRSAYNIELYLEFGVNLDYNKFTHTATETLDTVIVDLPSDVTDIANTTGQRKLFILPKCDLVDSEVHFTFRLGNSKSYSVKVVIVNTDNYAPILPNLKSANSGTSYFSNSNDSNFPLSNYELPIPIAEYKYNLGFSVNGVASELDVDKYKVDLVYDKTIFTVEKDTGEFNINNIQITVNESIIDYTDITKENFYIPMLVMVRDENDNIVSHKLIWFFRQCLVLTSKWKKPYKEFRIDSKDTGGGTFQYELLSYTPDFLAYDNAYYTWCKDNNVNTNLLYNILNLTGDGDKVSVSQVTSNITNGYKASANLKFTGNVDTDLNLKLTINNLADITDLQTITVGFLNDNTELTLPSGETIEITKDNLMEYSYSVRNAAKATLTYKGNAKDVKPNVNLVVDTIYEMNLPFDNSKVYPFLDGRIEIDTKVNKLQLQDYIYTLTFLDCEDTELFSKDITVKVARPRANPTIDLTATTIHIDKTKAQTIKVKGTEIHTATIDASSDLSLVDVTIKNIKKPANVNDKGVYATYNFDLVFTPKGTSGGNRLILKLADDTNNVVKTLSFDIDIYSVIYEPSKPNPDDTDIVKGLNVDISYTEKKGYYLPLVFINNGEELNGVLVAKYPLSQSAYDNTKNISKPNLERLTYSSVNKIKDLTTDEKGELHRIANPDSVVPVLNSIVNSTMLNNHAWPVANSAMLDTMLANLRDAHYLASVSKNNYSLTWGDTSSTTTSGFNRAPSEILEPINNGGKWKYQASNDTINTSDYVYGVETNVTGYQSENDYFLPLIPASTTNTHTGEKNGIVEAFGVGIKAYTDVLYKSGTNKELLILDPYQCNVEYTTDYTDTVFKDTKVYTSITYKKDQFITNTSTIMEIGVNDFGKNKHAMVFSGLDYLDNKEASLMDNVGLPFDNSVKDYDQIDTYVGCAGYRPVSQSTDHSLGKSTYWIDTDKADTKGYFISGSFTNSKLLKYDDTFTPTADEHIINLYGKDTILTNSTAGYRSRVMLNANTAYGINREDPTKNDSTIFHNRIHFLIYDKDKLDRLIPTRLILSKKFIEVEMDSTYTLDIDTDAIDANLRAYDVDTEYISFDLRTKIITPKKIGKTKFYISAAKGSGYSTTRKWVYVKVKPKVEATYLYTDTIAIQDKLGGTTTITVQSNASTLVFRTNNTTQVKTKIVGSIQDPNTKVYTHTVNVTVGNLTGSYTLTISATNTDMSTTSKTIPVTIEDRPATVYTITNHVIEATRDEIKGSINSTYLSRLLLYTGSNIDNVKSLALWSTELAGKVYKVNEDDYSFGIDFGSVDYTNYTLYYKAQIGQEFDMGNTIQGTEPRALQVDNLNTVVKGTIIIRIV